MPEERTLEDLIGAAFARPEAPLDEARQFVRLAAAVLAAYERLAPLSRERVALWRDLHFTVEALRTWT